MKKTITAVLLMAITWLTPVISNAAKWQVDKDKSKIEFVATINGAEAKGQFTAFTASIDFDPADTAGAVIKVDVEMASVKMPDPQLTASLGGADWFDVSQFPKAKFTSTSVEAKGDGYYEISADLTIRDKTLAVIIPFKFSLEETIGHAAGEVTLLRKNFDVGRGQFSTGATVGMEVKVRVNITAKQPN